MNERTREIESRAAAAAQSAMHVMISLNFTKSNYNKLSGAAATLPQSSGRRPPIAHTALAYIIAALILHADLVTAENSCDEPRIFALGANFVNALKTPSPVQSFRCKYQNVKERAE